jgi:hypothetical protein
MATAGIDIGTCPDFVRNMELALGRSCPVLPTTSVSRKAKIC